VRVELGRRERSADQGGKEREVDGSRQGRQREKEREREKRELVESKIAFGQGWVV
jgi:hypothetical protein